MEGEGGFPYYYPDSFAGPLPPPQGSAYLLPPQFVGCEPHATLISFNTHTYECVFASIMAAFCAAHSH